MLFFFLKLLILKLKRMYLCRYPSLAHGLYVQGQAGGVKIPPVLAYVFKLTRIDTLCVLSFLSTQVTVGLLR